MYLDFSSWPPTCLVTLWNIPRLSFLSPPLEIFIFFSIHLLFWLPPQVNFDSINHQLSIFLVDILNSFVVFAHLQSIFSAVSSAWKTSSPVTTPLWHILYLENTHSTFVCGLDITSGGKPSLNSLHCRSVSASFHQSSTHLVVSHGHHSLR